MSLQEAIKELEFINSIGGINASNAEHVQRIVDRFGPEAHEVFQEAAEDLHTFMSLTVAEPVAPSAG